ncbi:MAG TPA: hypothetical protein VFB75_25650 [Burkholderiales bacterium]|nr:hypothetical protein [Burkholderiales bacterium]
MVMRQTAVHERGGAARLLLGFVVGTLATVLAVRYVPSLREAALVEVNGADGATALPERIPGPGSNTAASGKPTAFRMSYELSRVPPEPPVPTERVVNARPISPVPPDPRDRTREIQKEAQNPQYREVPRSPSAPPGKVFEGRDVLIKPKPPEAPARAVVPATGATGTPPQLHTSSVDDQAAAARPPAKSGEADARGDPQRSAADTEFKQYGLE